MSSSSRDLSNRVTHSFHVAIVASFHERQRRCGSAATVKARARRGGSSLRPRVRGCRAPRNRRTAFRNAPYEMRSVRRAVNSRGVPPILFRTPKRDGAGQFRLSRIRFPVCIEVEVTVAGGVGDGDRKEFSRRVPPPGGRQEVDFDCSDTGGVFLFPSPALDVGPSIATPSCYQNGPSGSRGCCAMRSNCGPSSRPSVSQASACRFSPHARRPTYRTVPSCSFLMTCNEHLCIISPTIGGGACRDRNA